MIQKRLMIGLGNLYRGNERMRLSSLIRTAINKLIAGVILIVTVILGAIAGLIGLFIRQQLPETEELEATPPSTQESTSQMRKPQNSSLHQTK